MSTGNFCGQNIFNNIAHTENSDEHSSEKNEEYYLNESENPESRHPNIRVPKSILNDDKNKKIDTNNSNDNNNIINNNNVINNNNNNKTIKNKNLSESQKIALKSILKPSSKINVLTVDSNMSQKSGNSAQSTKTLRRVVFSVSDKEYSSSKEKTQTFSNQLTSLLENLIIKR
jgi:hypothetical protein